MKKSDLSRALLENGLTIRPQALEELTQFLTSMDILDLTSDSFSSLTSRLSSISVIDVEDVRALQNSRISRPTQFLVVLNVIRDLPHFQFSYLDEDFVRKEPNSVPDEEFSSVDMMKERLATIQAVLRGNKRFQASERLYAQKEPHIELITVDALVGSTDEKVVLGLLTRQDESKWLLEDSTGDVKLNLSCASPVIGYFPSGAVVLAQGEHQDGLFNVREIAHPPIAELFRSKVDLFGTQSYLEIANSDDEKVVHLEVEVGNTRFVILSDVHLDDIQTVDRLTMVLEGYQQYRNLVFVLMGDFLSTPKCDSEVYVSGFRTLAERIGRFENLREGCYWIVMPGPMDIGLGMAYPKDCLPDEITEPMDVLPHFISASNPCRIDISGKRLLFFSCDYIRKLRRNTALPASPSERMSVHFATTILSQAHLLPGREVTSIWELDHSLRVLPLPDVLCYADKCDSFTERMGDCLFLNPASFSRDFTFFFLNPKTNEAEECCLSVDS